MKIKQIPAAIIGILSLSTAVPLAAQQEASFTLKGHLDGMLPEKIFLSYYDNNSEVNDSTNVINNTFTFKGSIHYAAPAAIYFKTSKGNSIGPLHFYLDKSDQISVSGTFDELPFAKVVGSKTQDDFYTLKNSYKGIQEAEDKIYVRKSIGVPGPDSTDYYHNQLEVLENAKKEKQYQFALAHPNSFVSLYSINSLLYFKSDAELFALYNKLSDEIRNSISGIIVGRNLAKKQETAVGKIAPDFSLADTSGTIIHLKNFKGKYVLIDFWASWCMPCRAENPNVRMAYEKYKNKNFEIIGISLDQGNIGKLKWINAIKQDRVSWIQISDLLGFDSPVAHNYGIDAIPQNYLIDTKGTIIAKDLRGDELDATLSKYLNS